MVKSTQYIRGIINQHRQVKNNSCIPSAVEMVLKLLKKVPLNYYNLQNGWTNDGSFLNFDGQAIQGVTFRRINLTERGPNFPFDQLFKIINQELAEDRYVIIALLGMSDSGPKLHAYIVFDKDPSTEDYLTVTKASFFSTYVTQFDTDIKGRIREIQGTDILVYS